MSLLPLLNSSKPSNSTLIEAGPAAMAFELVLGSIKSRVAATANERARIFQIGVLTGEWPFCAFPHDDVSFLVGQFVVFGRRLVGIHDSRQSVSNVNRCFNDVRMDVGSRDHVVA